MGLMIAVSSFYCSGHHTVLNACCRDIRRKCFSHSLFTNGHSKDLYNLLIAKFVDKAVHLKKRFLLNFNQACVGVNTPRTCCAFHVTRFWTITDYVSENAFTYFGDVVDKNIATILLILGNDSYRAWFFLMHSSGPERGVKKHSERGHQMKVLKTEDLGFQYIIQDLLNFKARKTLSGLYIRKITLEI